MSTEPSTSGTDQVDQLGTNSTDAVTDAGKVPSEVTNAGNNPKPLSADEKKRQIVDSFQKRLDSGDITMEEVKERQPWVADELEQRQIKKDQPDLNDLAKKYAAEAAEKLFKERLAAEEVESLRRKIIESNPSSAQKREIQGNFNHYKDSLGEKGALELAAKLAGLNISSEAVKRSGMFIPDGVDVAPPEETVDSVIMDQSNRSDEEIIKAIRKKRGL